eukprot:12369983-Heterocapsa_arctica.AAC.1
MGKNPLETLKSVGKKPLTGSPTNAGSPREAESPGKKPRRDPDADAHAVPGAARGSAQAPAVDLRCLQGMFEKFALE